MHKLEPKMDAKEQFCTLANQKIALNNCNRDEFYDDGFNEITESSTKNC